MVIRHYDLQKFLGKKINGQIQKASTDGRFGGAEVIDKREQRKRDQKLGLIPFACKLPVALVEQLRDECTARNVEMNALVSELLSKALSK